MTFYDFLMTFLWFFPEFYDFVISFYDGKAFWTSLLHIPAAFSGRLSYERYGEKEDEEEEEVEVTLTT